MEGSLNRARYIALNALEGLSRGNGHPFIEHPDAVAQIVSREIGLGEDCVAAIYLHEASREHPELMEGIAEEFGADICTIVEGLNKISRIRPKDTRLEAENYKRLIVSYSKDPRVVVLKIADRLEIMRSLNLFPKAVREQKNLETLMLYIPLAHQLGLYNIKSEMEDIYFRHAQPQEWRSITNKLIAGKGERENIMQEFIRPLEQKLKDEGIEYKLKIRTKTAYSIWKKMQVQKVPFEGVYDVFAMRFIIDCPENPETEKALCWKVFSLVTEEYESDTKRLRDWISNPKPNGYESLHITVKNAAGAFLEVQIRTRRMDEIAESGLASHWSYKGIKKEASLDNWLNSVRTMLEKKESSDGSGDAPSPSESILVPNNDIFVFTPTGELRKLPVGATVLDFAFDIHSNLGAKCSGGLVNGIAVPIREKLKTGDYVEILKNKNQKPAADWLNFTVTSKARSKIRQLLKEEEFKLSREGKELLDSKAHKWDLDILDEDLAALMKKFRVKTLVALYEGIADGNFDLLDIKKFVEARHEAQVGIGMHSGGDWPRNGDAGDIVSNSPAEYGSNVIIEQKNLKGIDYKLAKCCNPAPGDEIFGFLTRLDGIKIHRISCPNAARLLEQYPYRIVKAGWEKK